MELQEKKRKEKKRERKKKIVSKMHLQVDLLMLEHSYLAVCKNKQLRSAHKASM